MHLEQYEPQSSSWRGSFLMFVAGTAVGAVAALMMAPATGRDSRDYIKKQSRKVADGAAAQADRLSSAVRWGRDHASTAVRDTMEHASTAVRDTMDTAVGQAKAAYNAARSIRTGEGQSANASGLSGSTSTSSSPRPATP